jgi:hypothetical protein
MPELIAKANQAILEALYLRRQGRSLRSEASLLANKLGQTIVQTQDVEKTAANLKSSLDQAFSKP